LGRVIGIDLGTTNSCVAVLDERGTPQVLSDSTGERTTPSVVAWPPGGKVVVGHQARRQAVTNPQNTIFGTKRLIGRKVNADEVSWFARMVPFRIVAAPNGDAWIRVREQSKSPQEIASHVMAKMRAIAEQALGEPVTQAVVTVPAYFDDAQRQATRDAGTIAGVDVIRILNEPTAAALAYGAHRVKTGQRTIAVFDLGGGTFDVSIMSVDHGIFEVLATNGDTALGGDDFDRRVIDVIADEVFNAHRVDICAIPVALGRVKESVEQAKRLLSQEKETTIHLPYLAQDDAGKQVHLERLLRRDEFESLTQDLLDRLRIPCERAMTDAQLAPHQIEEVLLVGGMSRWPAVQTAVEQIFGRRPSKGANPDEIVAMGAAAHGGILSGQIDDAALLDVAAHSIGIRVGESAFSTIIPRNSMLPARTRKLFATSEDDQKFVQIEIFQGEEPDVRRNRKLGEIRLEDLPRGPAGSVRVELTITADVESILHVNARELRSGNQTAVRLAPSGGLSADDIAQIIERRRTEEGPASDATTSTAP
jgi:molecular chaperone DnaK